MPYNVMYNKSVYGRRKFKKKAEIVAKQLRKRVPSYVKVAIEYQRPKKKR